VTGLPYLLPYVVPIAIVAGCLHGDVWPFRMVPVIFVTVTILDTLVAVRAPEPIAGDGPFWKMAVWMWAPAQAAIVVCGLITVTRRPIDLWTVAAVTMSVGMTGGMLNVPAAHELMHGRRRVERALGQFLMLLLSYPHFCVEHVTGHHVRVATLDDPATARRGQNVYAFLVRSALRGCASAWHFEAERMHRQQRWPIGPGNRVIRALVLAAILYAAVAFVFGWRGVLFFAAQSLIGVAMLEVINYVQHYGLVRRTLDEGRHERITRMHSWNSGHPVSNWFLLNLGHHAPHHCDGATSYRELPQWTDAPQLPVGLFAMFVLALVPPLWRSVMDPLVDQIRARQLKDA
jgi:alkane 1-monooxygenase